MSTRFSSLPLEVQVHILRYLPHRDLINAVRVSTVFRSLAAPLLWSHIELHVPEWHRYVSEHDSMTSVKEADRYYISLPPGEELNLSNEESNLVFRLSGSLIKYYRKRSLKLLQSIGCEAPVLPQSPDIAFSFCSYVKSICMDVDFDNELGRAEELAKFWQSFSKFANLESLELTVMWPYDPKAWYDKEAMFCSEDVPITLTKLKHLHLRGYLPRSFVRWLLRSSKNLQSLELFTLDRPISGSAWGPQRNPPQSKGTQSRFPLEDLEDDGGEIPWVTEDSDSDSGTDYSEKEIIAPRPMRIFDTEDVPSNLQGILTLHLIRPMDSGRGMDEEDNYSSWDEAYYSARCDTEALQEWADLIRATRQTIQHMILDQRPFFDDRYMEGTEAIEFLERYPYGPGFKRFKEIVFPVLMEDTEWPALKSIQLRGFDVPEVQQTKTHPRVMTIFPSQQLKQSKTFLPALKDRFESLGVETSSVIGRRLMFDPESGVVESEDGVGGTIWD